MEKMIQIEMTKCPVKYISQVAALIDAVREEMITCIANGEYDEFADATSEASISVLRWLRDSFNDAAVANGEQPYYMTDTKHTVWNL